MDTIFAEATPPGRGGVSIVRLSGPEAWRIGSDVADLGPARQAVLRSLRDGDEVIDRALVLAFEAGDSFTGEPVVEFHVHGAPVVVRRLERALAARGAVQAGPGEFTRRAFRNGRMDLTEVQGLSDLLQAETEAQRQLSMRNATGELGRLAAGWRRDLVRAGALIMASLDFPDEDVPEAVPAEVFGLLDAVRGGLLAALAGHEAAAQVRRGFTVAILGPPNAGKSSLINRIAGREVALVTDIAGTTRDALEVFVDLGGLPVTFVDTAGLREASDPVERKGVVRAEERAAAADLRLHLAEDGAVQQALWREGDLAVRTKADMHGAGVSSLTGAGIDALLAQVRAVLAERVAGAGIVAHAAQADRLRAAAVELGGACALPPELLAERVRGAGRALEALLGRVDMEEYLDLIFSSFCIGK